MTVDAILNRLQHVKRAGRGQWRAQCPAHDGQNKQSLSVRDDDGTVLLKCFAHECSAADIVSAVGLELHDLFPPRDLPAGEHRRKPVRKPWTAYDVLQGIAHELTVAAIIVCDVAKRGTATDDERQQLLGIAGRIGTLQEMVR